MIAIETFWVDLIRKLSEGQRALSYNDLKGMNVKEFFILLVSIEHAGS